VDLHDERITHARVDISGGVIVNIVPTGNPVDNSDHFIMPGFVDAHIHIESSMLTPAHFAQAAVVHGTVATVSDPHEIANVLGIDGVRFMIDDAQQAPLKICFGAPSCVPATTFESAGAALDAQAVTQLLAADEIGYLSEMMNFPGVLAGDAEVMAKIAAAKKRNKPVDGHAPGLRGHEAARYIQAGITTDHECTSKEEALDKLSAGAIIQIREGSAARNFEALYTLINQFPDRCMFCSDDKHPDDFVAGHIDRLARRAVAGDQDLMKVLKCACLNPVFHYDLDVGLLRLGDPADFIVVTNLKDFEVVGTYIDGRLVAHHGLPCFEVQSVQPINKFLAKPRHPDDFVVNAKTDKIRVIEAWDGELTTTAATTDAKIDNGQAVADVEQDLLKITVVNRYGSGPPAVAFIRNVGLKRGAIASSVAHDSHNIVAVGANDADLCAAVNQVIDDQGGLAVVAEDELRSLPLPVAGLMSLEPLTSVSAAYMELDQFAKELGTPLRAPFMTLSFMALLVIPSLKLSDQGLFDVDRFEFVSLFV
jgi:adenine deaminase